MKILGGDTSSHVGAALHDWKRPATAAELVLMNLYDRFADAHFKNPRPYPRPWDKPVRLGRTTLSPDEAIARLRRAAGRTA
jgi:hypothetical protein